MVYRFPTWVRSSYNQDGAVVLDIRSNRIFNFNQAGSALLQVLSSGAASSVVLSQALAERYGIAADAADRDVSEFLDQLQAYRLVEST